MPLPADQIRACLSSVGALIEKRRPKPEIRHLVDLKAEITGQEVILSEVRPSYADPALKLDYPVAKVRWIGAQNRWRLYWRRADLKWHVYAPGAHLSDIESIMGEIDRDPVCCFWG